jgi:hypothetical protein
MNLQTEKTDPNEISDVRSFIRFDQKVVYESRKVDGNVN